MKKTGRPFGEIGHSLWKEWAAQACIVCARRIVTFAEEVLPHPGPSREGTSKGAGTTSEPCVGAGATFDHSTGVALFEHPIELPKERWRKQVRAKLADIRIVTAALLSPPATPSRLAALLHAALS